MAIWRAQVEWQSTTLLPEDKVVNTWHFEGSDTATDTDNIRDMLVDFYTTPYEGNPIKSFMPAALLNGFYDIKIFCLADPEPRVPRATYNEDTAVSSNAPLPGEVALCLSYHGAVVSGESQARRRGRIYLGPFTTAANASGRPTSAVIATMTAAASELLAAANASVTWQWIVYSRVNDAGVDVVGGWVDNAWDSQRRRGLRSTARTAWT